MTKLEEETVKGFFEWMKTYQDGQFQIPTPRLYKLYRCLHPDVMEITDGIAEFLSLYTENIMFDKGIRGVFKGDVTKFSLANDYGWSERVQKKEEESTDYVQWNFGDLKKEPTINHDGESLENEAVTEMMKNKDGKKL